MLLIDCVSGCLSSADEDEKRDDKGAARRAQRRECWVERTRDMVVIGENELTAFWKSKINGLRRRRKKVVKFETMKHHILP